MQHLILFAVLAVLFVFMVPSAFRFVRGAGLAVAMLLLIAVPAMAQETVSDVINTVMPDVLKIVSVVLMFILGWVLKWIRAKTGIDIQAAHRESMHSALMTAARLAVARQLTGQAAMSLILEYVRKSVPDALASLKPSPDVLKELAESKLQAALAEQIGGLIRR